MMLFRDQVIGRESLSGASSSYSSAAPVPARALPSARLPVSPLPLWCYSGISSNKELSALEAAIKSKFGGNYESKKIQRNVLKHQFKNFTTTPNESLDKAYDRFQKLISQLEVHAAPISREDINQKFLRSLPPSWSQIALIMRNKPDIDQTDINDLYNNLRVYKDEMKRSLSSTSNSQNLAFLSFENTSSTNEVSTASVNFRDNTAGGTNSSSQVLSTLGVDEVVCSFFAQQTTSPLLDNEDLQQIDQDDLEELDIRWQVAMLSVKKRHFAKECNLGWNQGKRSYDDNGRRNATSNKPSSQALVAQDGLGGYDWSNDFDKPVNYALMAISSSSSSSSSDNEIENQEESSKGLNKLLNSQMSAKDKYGLGYGTQLDEMSNKSETDSEISLSVFEVRLSDKEITPANDKFSKAVGYHAVPLLITGNFLTPRADISFACLDEYAIRKKIIETNGKRAVHTVSTARPISTARPVSTARSYYTKPAFRPKNLKQDVKTSGVKNMTTPGIRTVVNIGKGKMDNALKKSRWVWRPKGNYMDHESKEKGSFILKKFEYGNLKICLEDHAVVDSGFSSHMTSNKAYLSDYEDYNEGFVAFGSDPKGDELKFNLFSVSQMCDKKNSVLFTDTECLILSPSFKLLDENQVVLRAPRQNGVYSLDLKNIVPSGEFKNHAMNESCAKKRIKREFSVARTPQQNGVAERKNRTLIEAARTMLADSLLPSIVVRGSTTPNHITKNCLLYLLGKFDGKSDEGYLLGYFTTSKAFRVYNKRTKRVKENMHIDFLKDQPNMAGSGPDCMFDLDFLTNTINYIPVSVENQVNVDASTQEHYVADFEEENKRAAQATSINKLNTGRPSVGASNSPLVSTANTPYASAASTPTDANTGGSSFVYLGGQIPIDASTLPNVDLPIDPNMPDLEDDSNVFPNDGIFSGAYDDEDVGAEADFNNMDNTIDVSPIPTLRVHKDHPKGQILGDPKSAVQTRGNIQKASSVQQALVSYIYNQNRTDHKDHHNCLLACFLSQEEPKTISQALKDESWVKAMQEDLLQFKLQKVWILVDLPSGKKVILAFASFMGFPVYQMDVKSAFLYGTIEEEVKQQPDGIFISQDKYVADILKKFDFCSIKTATTPIVSNKPLVKDEDGVDVDVHVYRSMIGSLMYLTTSRPDIMFAVCACVRLRATYDAELASAASLVNTARPTLSTTRLVSMANLEFVDQHNMVACLEKTEGNSDFHEIVDFLASSSIHHALTINATVDSKAVVVTEASIRSSLLFNDADGTACLTNEAIFQNLALMGYEGDFNKLTFQKALFSPQWKFLIHTILHCLSSKSTSWNEFSTNIASAVICLATNQKFNFSKLIFDGMLRNLDNTKKKFLMYLRFLMVFLNNQIELGKPFNDVYLTPARNLKVFSNMSRKGVKFSGKVTPLFDSMLVPHQAPEGEGSEQPTEPQPTPSPTQPSTGDQPPETSSSHATTQDSRDTLEGTNGNEGDQELLVYVLTCPTGAWLKSVHKLSMKKRFGKNESVSKQGRKKSKPKSTLDDSIVFKDQDADHESSRPERSILTLKPLPTIDPKDKGKSVLEEPEPAKKMTRSNFDVAQIARDAEIAKQLQVDLQAGLERERQREEEASKAAIAEMYDEVQAGIDADALFAAKLQQEEREEYTIEERAKFLAETIAAQRKFRAAQRSAEIRSMYERQKKSVQDFVPIGSAKEEELIKKMNEKATDEDTSNKEKVLEEPDSTKVEVKQEGHEDSTRKRPGRRLKMKATKKSKRQKTDSDLEEEEQLKDFSL
ncbi:putative ribonuclease H-like domain-containing protein [Tanacetum coccineum]|uniref:Ribonuclease H-like domain-containing protein n=1 Tax=Tanacetum coccineum TaxID=301880 RepID=A0ABQ5GH46_9ASTR